MQYILFLRVKEVIYSFFPLVQTFFVYLVLDFLCVYVLVHLVILKCFFKKCKRACTCVYYFCFQDQSQKPNKTQAQQYLEKHLQVLEKRLEFALQHWRERIGMPKKDVIIQISPSFSFFLF